MAITVSVLQGGTNSHLTTSEEVNTIGTDFVSEGVVGAITNTAGVAPATGAFAANAQGTPDMTVAVSAGVGYVTATPTSGNSQTLRVKNSASANVTISANSTGGTRFDWVYIKIDPDKAKDPAVDASDVATLVVSRSTSAGTDNGTPPTYGYPIAVVTVANGASSITNGNIADVRSAAGVTPGSENANGYPVDWYQEIGRTTLTGAGDALSAGSLPVRKYLKAICHIKNSGTVTVGLRFNGDSGNNYAWRYFVDTTTGTGTSTNRVGDMINAASSVRLEVDVVNVSTSVKVGRLTLTGTGTSAGTAPSYAEFWFAWVNTSDNILSIDIVNTAAGDYAIGSELVVLGHD